MARKKHVLTFEEFLREKRIEQNKPGYKMVDWDIKKEQWLEAINNLYKIIDEVIVDKLRKAGYNIAVEQEPVRIIEDYMGSYDTYNYILKTNSFKIRFCPISAIMIQYNGRVDMILPKGTVKLILAENYTWKISQGFSVPMDLIDFNEKNIQRVFEDYL